MKLGYYMLILPDVDKRPWKNLDSMLRGFIQILDGITLIISLGYYQSSLYMRYLIWRNDQQQKRLLYRALRS